MSAFATFHLSWKIYITTSSDIDTIIQLYAPLLESLLKAKCKANKDVGGVCGGGGSGPGGRHAELQQRSCCALELLRRDSKDVADNLLDIKDCFGCNNKYR